VSLGGVPDIVVELVTWAQASPGTASTNSHIHKAC
jgi:hypothetical protein